MVVVVFYHDEIVFGWISTAITIGLCNFYYEAFFKYVSNIVTISSIGGGNRSTRRKHRPAAESLANLSHNAGLELITLVVIGTDCTGICKFNYHAIMTTTIPLIREETGFF
jgi:O-acetyl-ADP-ribose deacetylase (regulator of RNase III)